MPDVFGRLRAAATATLTAALLAALIIPSVTQAVDPPNVDRFMAALGAVESHGRYDAVNATSGAIGKYQILPANWASWSLRYLGTASAAPTPANQDAVARHKLIALYGWLGSWGSVAHWWLTGDGDTDPAHWSAFSRSYVDRILALMGAPGLRVAPAPARVAPRVAAAKPATQKPAPVTVFDQSNNAVHYSGGWGQAEYAGYSGGQVRYAIEAKTSVTFSFHGSSITWVGPKGPTRGQARVYIEDQLVRTVDVYSGHFQPRANLFSMTFDRMGDYTIRIEVVGTPGRQTIAVDEFDVGG